MSYITKSVTVVITLFAISNVSSTPYVKYDLNKEYTRNITLRQGTLQGVVLSPKINKKLPKVEVYRGVPYAAPPVGELRFMPTGGAPSWFGIKYADTFGPVCPQQFPDEKNMPPYRKEYFLRLKQYLLDQSEDCLYLNIYAPVQGKIFLKYFEDLKKYIKI